MAVEKNSGTGAAGGKASGGSPGKTGTENPRKPAGTKAPSGKRRKNSKSPWGVIFWVAFFIIIFSLFFVNRANIIKTFEDTRFFERIMNRQVNGIENQEPVPPLFEKDISPENTDGMDGNESASPIEIKTVEPPAQDPPPKTTLETAQPVLTEPEAGPVNRISPPEVKTEESPPAGEKIQTTPEVNPAAVRAVQTRESPELRERSLYFTRIDSEGDILRVEVKRRLPASDSPMLDILNSLMAGPSSEEQKRGLVSLIPWNSKILNATVRGSTAYISFSEEFQYNPHGIEGYAASLRQIIWTVTEFPNVKDVQILIEGRRIDYLGEGIWIGSPINRTF